MATTRRSAARSAKIFEGQGVAEAEKPLWSQILRPTYTLQSWHEVPLCLQYNRFVLTGYRAHLTTRQTLSSLFHWHNESGNVWTHGIAWFIFSAMFVWGLFVFEWSALALWTCQWAAMAVCFAMSVVYHAFQCHGECSVTSYQYWLGLDLKGIVFAYVSSSIRRIWYSLYCHPSELWISYGSLVLGVVIVFSALNSQFALRSQMARVLAFGTLMLLVNVSTFYMWALSSGSPTGRQRHVLAIVLQIVGSMINAARVPERWLPGRFDFVLNSHQIMHMMSIAGVWCTWTACTIDMHHMERHACAHGSGLLD